jgi:hypothetical protein
MESCAAAPACIMLQSALPAQRQPLGGDRAREAPARRSAAARERMESRPSFDFKASTMT